LDNEAMGPVWPVILCGGAGRRLWPLSRPDRPKPLLSFGGEPLLTATARRFSGPGFDTPWLVAGQAHADAMAALLPEAGLVEEPVGRGTAAAVAVAALLGFERAPETLVLISPADHVVQQPAVLREAVLEARAAAWAGSLVTFGIVPTRAATEYGWIWPGEAITPSVRQIRRFLEKPDAQTAERLLAGGEHLWNAGLFLFRADVALEELRRWAPEVLAAARGAVRGGSGPRRVLEAGALASSPSVSFDVAVMERTERAAVRPTACGWSDVGTWGAVAALGAPGPGPVTLQDSPGAYVYSDGPQVAVLGAPGVVVVATGGAVLVAGPGQADRCGALPVPVDVTLDQGPGHEVLRRSLEAGAALTLEPGSIGVVLAGELEGAIEGRGPGDALGAGSYRARRRSTVVIVRRREP
jgi:mannose-1-phosphate guanylyltransferase/mannose-6-phosphate isomerase